MTLPRDRSQCTTTRMRRVAPRAKQHKALLVGRVIRIGKQQRLLVLEHCLGFREAHPVLPRVSGSFARVPFEAGLLHNYNVSTL